MNETDTIKTSLIGEAAAMLARLWAQHLKPAAYDRIFYLDGVRVRVTIDEHKTAETTQPMNPAERRTNEK